MDRRRFLSGSLALLAAPLVAEAQQTGKTFSRPPRVAILHLTPATPPIDAFRKAMRDLGWTEGRTLVIEYREAGGKVERLDPLAAEIVSTAPDVIVTGTSGAAIAGQRATTTIPIVMAVSADPVGLGLLQSLARPGGNITGQAILSPELSAKRLEVLKEALPSVSRAAIFWNGAAGRAAVDRNLQASQDAAQALGIRLHPIEVPQAEEIEAAFQEARRARAGAIVTIQSALFYALNARLADLSPLGIGFPCCPPRVGSQRWGGS